MSTSKQTKYKIIATTATFVVTDDAIHETKTVAKCAVKNAAKCEVKTIAKNVVKTHAICAVSSLENKKGDPTNGCPTLFHHSTRTWLE